MSYRTRVWLLLALGVVAIMVVVGLATQDEAYNSGKRKGCIEHKVDYEGYSYSDADIACDLEQ
jgi:hypothetical protein